MEKMKFNTVVAALMSLLNDFYEQNRITRGEFKVFLILLNPAAPHITEELWIQTGFPGYLHEQQWPAWEENKITENIAEIAIQVNGRLRGVVCAQRGAVKETVKSKALENENVQKHLAGKAVLKEIYVPDQIFNFVVER
jgi:leucyl-tRNA synthetase